MTPHELVAKFSAAIENGEPMAAARKVVESLKQDLSGVTDALSYLSGTGGNARQAFFRAPRLSLLKVSFPRSRRTPPHNHGTWAVILVLCGRERNTLYTEDANGGLRRASAVELGPGSVLPMAANTVHVAECLGSDPAIGLHVYGADVLQTVRHMWDPETLQRQRLDWTLYEALARKASAAASAPLC